MDNVLPILGIETSGDICSVCLYENKKRFVEKNVLEKHIHSEKILSIIDDCLNELKGLDSFGAIALSIGPGSFTGLRIGMAAAKGIAIGENIPIIPVPTMDAFAYGIIPYLVDGSQFVVVNNVNRDELYFARYEKKGYKAEAIIKPQLLDLELLEENIIDSEQVFGSYTQSKTDKFSPFPSALNISRWAYFFGKELLTYDIDYLEPNYLKNFVAKVKND